MHATALDIVPEWRIIYDFMRLTKCTHLYKMTILVSSMMLGIIISLYSTTK